MSTGLDFDKVAERFDAWIPHMTPVSECLLDAIDAQPGERILDVATGTGEPALTLARRLQDQLEIIGIDAADGMVRAARTKAALHGLRGLTFHCMPGESLAFGDAGFDAVLCRFGLMFFEDPQRGLHEMHRVLKPGGRLAVAVWSSAERMPTLAWAHQALRQRVPEELLPPLEKASALGEPGKLEGLCSEVGFQACQTHTAELVYRFPDFAAYWQTVEASGVLQAPLDSLSTVEREAVRAEIATLSHQYQGEAGLRIPHEYLWLFARKPL